MGTRPDIHQPLLFPSACLPTASHLPASPLPASHLPSSPLPAPSLPPLRVPFEAKNLHELKVKVRSGAYTPLLPGRYSADLVNLCHLLLSQDPSARPTPDTILSSSAAAK